MQTVLTIAGSDCSGGAGIQADLKTIGAHGLYGMSVITSLTAQNTTGVYGILDIPPDFTAAQLDAVMCDIPPDAVKIGMVSKTEIIRTIALKLQKYKPFHVVIDPVMVSTSGSRLLAEDAITALCDYLFPFAELITPNIPEAEVLCGCNISSAADMEYAAERLREKFSCAILIKGGHGTCDARDFLLTDQKIWLEGEWIDTKNTHGTGCTLSSAIACNLAAGYDLEASVSRAKKYLFNALRVGLNLGKGCGPVNHFYHSL